MNNLLSEFFGQGNRIKPTEVDPALHSLLDSWLETILLGGFGFLPRGVEHRTYWYAFAPSPTDRRELLELLDAWVGPTYSDLRHRRGELDRMDAFDIPLIETEVPPIRFEVLPHASPASGQAKLAVRNALTTLTRLLNMRPPSQFDALRTTVEILDDLGHAIAASDRSLAATCMAELEQSADLDESNLAFLRMRFNAGLRDWEAMFADPALEHVLAMRRPLGVTRAIQAGLYFDRFLELDHYGSEEQLHAAAKLLDPPLRDLYTGVPPTTRPEALVELLSRLQNVGTGPDDPAIEELIRNAAHIQQGLDAHFESIVREFFPSSPDVETASVAPMPASDPIAQIGALMLSGQHAACIELGLTSEPSVEIGRALVYAARQVYSAEWSAKVVDYLNTYSLREALAATGPTVAADIESLESACRQSPASGWEDWFFNLSASESQPVDPTASAVQTWEPLSAQQFKELLYAASDDNLAKLGEYGGQFLAAHNEALESFDSPELVLRLVAAVTLGGKASAGIRAQTLALVESVTAGAPEQSIFEDLLEWVGMVLDTNIAATTVSWACDIVAALTSVPAPGSTDAVLGLFYKAIAAIRPYRTALDGADLEALDLVASELGIEIPSEFHAVEADDTTIDAAAPYRYLAGKTVVLHSLTESAITRASQVLRRLVPSIDVKTNSEHDGSTQLAQMSANADVFVVVTASAKHAATTFIAAYRKNSPTVLVNSRGSSAILRALAEFVG
ncbi:protein DpdD [Gordonia sp. NPDC062954]|uniref:protein DpdD n=1 Tax=Gordonia sp. NPDC062954 TaxID=3364003 RepID=UPI0037C50177